MSGGIVLLISLISLIVILFLGDLIYKMVFLHFKKTHRKSQTESVKFLQVRIQKNAVAKSGDIEATDHVQGMKNNIELMNQVYKNFYSIVEDSRKHKRLGNNYISMELVVEKEQIKYFIGVPEDHLSTVKKMIAAFYPSSMVEDIEQPKLLDAGKYMAGGEFHLTKHSVHPIKTYESFEADPMDSLLSAYNNTNKDEKMVLQILVQPLHEKRLKKLRKKAAKIKEGKDFSRFKKIFFRAWKGGSKEDSQHEKNQEEKHKHDFSQTQIGDFDKKMDDEIFLTKIRVFATSLDKNRPNRMVDEMGRLFNQYNYVGLNTLKLKKAKNIKDFAKDLVLRSFYTNNSTFQEIKNFHKDDMLNIKEISSIIHFPHARFNQNPRIARQKSKIVPAPENMPSDGMHLGRNEYGGVKKDVILSDTDRFRHVYIVGQTGTGKSTMILTQAKEDMNRGNGFCVIDPHGDLVDTLMKHFPKERIDDLIYFDLSNTEYPIAFNPLDGAHTDDERDVVTNDMVEMFVDMYGPEIFGPRLQDYFRHACFLLMEQPDGGTLVDIMRLFTDDAYAESKIRNVKNPVIAAWWNKTYKKMGDREKSEIIPFFQAKFGPFTTGTYIRNVVGQPKSAFNFSTAMQEGKIVMCKLAKGLTGEINSQLIGRMVAMQIKLAALKRASITEDQRKPYFLYVDEFQNYVSESFESILSEARKYRLGLTMAHQYIDQLKKDGLGGNLDMSKTIFGNVGTIFALKVGAIDAEPLEQEFSPEFNKMDLQNSEKFKGIIKMSINGSQSRPFSITTRTIYGDPAVNTPEKIEIMKQISALKRGTKRELVDKEIYFRVGV
ncbi:MAG TPA: TraM recognition domain-containing protein [Candidatus Absconditabacterales bacterium]|nr:TraM recognition domain-containing protein [Candidatus Absconditabacterales bacterium]